MAKRFKKVSVEIVCFCLLISIVYFIRIVPSASAEDEQASTPLSGREKYEIIERIFPVYFCDLGETQQLVQKMFSPKKVIKNKSRNVLIVKDTSKKLESIGRFLKDFDIAPKVIMVEGTIINLNVEKALKLGFDISSIYDRSALAKPEGLDKWGGKVSFKRDTKTATNPTTPVNVFFDFFNPTGEKYNLDLNVLLEHGAAEILLKPHITFLSGTTGSFRKVTNVPQVSASQYGSNVDVVPVGLTLSVSARYIPPLEEGGKSKIYISNLKITDGAIISQVPGETAFITEELVIETEQLVENGQLIVLGGAINTEKRVEINKIPLLGDIPVIKYLFRNTKTYDIKTERLALLRLTVVTDTSYAYKASDYKMSKDFQSTEYGGKVHDSINVHPLSAAQWGSKIIYTKKLYFGRIYGEIPEEKQEEIGQMFIDRIRARVPLTWDWENMKFVKQVIYADKELPGVFVKFSDDTGLTPQDILIIASHMGAINDKVYKIYRTFLKKNKIFNYGREK